MLRMVLASILLSLPLCVFSQSNIELVYSELKLRLPGQFTLIGALGDMGEQEDILVFRYGDKLGKNYIAFSDMTNDASIDYGCSINVFYNDLFSNNLDSRCNHENLDLMRKVFIENKEVSVWTINGYVLNYSSGKNKSFAFVSGRNGKLIGIESDFIDKKTYQNMLRDI